MALIYKSLNNWSCSVLRDCICPCLLSWFLRLPEMSLFFRPEQEKYEETRRESVTFLKKKKKNFKLEEGKLGEVLLSVNFFRFYGFGHFFFNTILLLTKIERTVIWFHTFPSNIGVTPILLSRYAHLLYYCGSWYWGIPVFTYFIFPGLILCLPSKQASFNFMTAVTICSDFGAPQK